MTSLEIKQESYDNETFYTTIGEINGIKTVSILNDQAVMYAITKKDNFSQPKESEVFIFKDRYSLAVFQGIIPDSGASRVSTASEQQFIAL